MPGSFRAGYHGAAREEAWPQTLRNITGAWIQDHELVLAGGKITEYRVRMRLTFVLKD